MKRKTLQGQSIELKQGEEEGRFSAVFATLSVIDHDGDVILPGAIETGQKVRISAYNHSSWGDALPVGKGVVTEQGEQLIVDGQFFLDTQSGAETYKTVKNLEDLTEYSFGFDVTDSEFGQKDGKDVQFLKGLNIYEVSPVLLGAGIGTRTLDIKSEKEADGETIEEEPEEEESKSETFADHATRVLDDVAELNKRCRDIVELRASKGKGLGKDSADRVEAIKAELKKAVEIIEEITAEDDTVNQEYLKFIERRIKHE